MRKALLAAALALVLLAPPASAQRFPIPAAEPTATGRVLLDMTLTVIPQETTAFCPLLEAGRLDMTIRAVGQDQPRPVSFAFSSARGADPDADMLHAVTGEEAALTVPVRGGLYCASLTNEAPTSPGAGLAELAGLRQGVSIRMTLTPR